MPNAIGVEVKDIKRIFVDDDGHKIHDACDRGKGALLIDRSDEIAGRFMLHSGAVMKDARKPKLLNPEQLRLAALNAVRQGKPLALDIDDETDFDEMAEQFDKIGKGLLDELMTRKICKDEKYRKLIKDSDDQNIYGHYHFQDDVMDHFHLLFIARQANPKAKFKESCQEFYVKE